MVVSKFDITATVEAETALQSALEGMIEAIGPTTEMRDPYTAGHQQRVTDLAVAIAEEMELEPHRVAYDILKRVTSPGRSRRSCFSTVSGSTARGIPRGSGEAHILAVASILSKRPHRAAAGIEAPLDEIEKQRGIRCDAVVVDACLNLLRNDRFSFEDEAPDRA